MCRSSNWITMSIRKHYAKSVNSPIHVFVFISPNYSTSYLSSKSFKKIVPITLKTNIEYPIYS